MSNNLNIFSKNTKSWANIMNESSEKRRKTRHVKRRALGQASRTRSPTRSGDTKMVGKHLMIYTTEPVVIASGKTVHGHWVKATDPEGDYEGPYANARKLINNPRYKSDMANIIKNMESYAQYKRENPSPPTRSRRSPSPPRSRRSRSPPRSRRSPSPTRSRRSRSPPKRSTRTWRQ